MEELVEGVIRSINGIVATLVWEGLAEREISKLKRTTEQVIKNHLLPSLWTNWEAEPAPSWLRPRPAMVARLGWTWLEEARK